jgi:predicted DNA-binding protein
MEPQDPKPDAKSKDGHIGEFVGCRIPRELKERLKKLAARNRRTVATEIKIAIEERLAAQEGTDNAT